MTIHEAKKSGSKSRILSSLSWLLFSRVLNASASLVYLAAMTRTLSLEQFGVFSVIIATAQLIYSLLDFNTWQIMVKYGAAHRINEDHAALSRLTLYCIALEVGSAGVGISLILLLYPFVANQIEWTKDVGGMVFIFVLFFQLCFRSTAIGLLRVGEFFREGAMAESTMPILRMTGALIVAYWAPDIGNFLFVWLISEAIFALAHWYFALTRSGLSLRQNPVMAVRTVLRDEADIWRFSWITNMGGILYTVNQHIVMLFTGWWLGPAAAGIFRIGHQLGKAMAGLFEIVSRTLYTEFNHLHAELHHENMKALLRQTNRIAMMGGILLVAILIIFGKNIITILVGADYLMAYNLVILMALASIIELISATYQAALITLGYPGSVLVVRIISSLALLISLFAFINHYGANAPAMATLIASIFTYIGLRFHITRAYTTQPVAK